MDQARLDAARGLLAEALYIDVGSLEPDAAIGRDERWDSLAHLRLMLALEQRLGRLLAPEEIAGVASIADIAALLAGPP